MRLEDWHVALAVIVAFAIYGLGVVSGAEAALDESLKTLTRVREGYTLMCTTGIDEPEGECEARWQRLLAP